MPTPIREYLTPVAGGAPSGLFPTIKPNVEDAIYQAVREAASTRVIFPEDGQGLQLPLSFNIPPDIGLFAGMDQTYKIPPGAPNSGQPIPPIKVVRGWPAFPGQVPSIGVAEATSNDDLGSETTQGGFAGDVFAYDDAGNVIATAAYYAAPLRTTVVVELIHTNRDERDRLHDQLERVLYPLRRLLPGISPQIHDVQVSGEKQDLPLDEQPIVIYVSVFTVEVSSEALIPTEITTDPVITEVDVTVTPTEIERVDYTDLT